MAANTALFLDFETRSALDLKEVGLHNYARHPTTDVWCMAWAIDGMEPLVWEPGHPLPTPVEDHIMAGLPIYAHNAPFELEVWNVVCRRRYGWPELKPEQMFCTMAMAYAMGLPGALEDAALALGLQILKDTEGRGLMLRMAKPRAVLPGMMPKYTWWDEPEKLKRLYAYCQQDVRVERELAKRLMPLSDKERQVWLADYKINQRGIAVDVPTAKAGIELVAAVKATCDAELATLTKGAVQTVTAVGALKDWIATKGVKAEGLAKQDVVDLLDGDTLTPRVAKALSLRQEAGKASTAKLGALVSRAGADDRLRALVQYHGAATGRWAGRGVQVHNLPRSTPPPEVMEAMLAHVRAGEVRAIDAIYGPPLTVLSNCLRGFFVPKPGHVLVAGDFANVEGRGVAWFSGEDWKVKAFREADAGTGPGLYELAYAKAFNVPVESVKNPSFERQVGKVMELAFGFGGGAGAFATMGSTMGVKVEMTKANEFKDAWRAAHPRTKATWRQLERAAISAVQNPGEKFTAGHPGREATFKTAGSFLWCRLPSGRVLCYPYAKILEGAYGPQLTYMTVPSPEDKKKGRIIADPKNVSNWSRVATYGGSLMENVIQALCRDLLVDCVLLPFQDWVVLHVHDEGVLEVPAEKAEAARAALAKAMRTPPEWAKGFPLYAECSVMARYGA